jgi:DNA-binding transcriptional regulator YiaG
MDTVTVEAMHRPGTPFGELLQQERVGRRLSIARAAKQAGVREAVWRTWEAGEDRPNKVQLRRAFGDRCQIQHYLPTTGAETLAPMPRLPSPAQPLRPDDGPPLPVTAAPPRAPAPPVAPPPPPPPARTFGEHLQRLREGVGLTMNELAELVEVNPSLVRDWEGDAVAPPPAHYTSLASLMPELCAGPQPPTAMRQRAGTEVVELHDPLGALERVVRALEALGQSVVQTYFMPGADGSWEFVVRPNDDRPLAVGVRASDPAVVRHALASLRAGMATRHAQAERIACAASARADALAGTLAAIDGALLDRAA